MNDPRDAFLEIYQSKIKRAGSEELLEWLTSSDFFTAPASTRYHGSFEGGLVTHSVNVYRCLAEELELSGLSDAYTEETVALVSLLHDVCKANFYKKGTRNVKENGQWVTKEVFEIDEKFPCGHGEKSVVKGGDYFIGKIFEKSKLALLLHVADMKATYLLEG